MEIPGLSNNTTGNLNLISRMDWKFNVKNSLKDLTSRQTESLNYENQQEFQFQDLSGNFYIQRQTTIISILRI